MIDDAIKILKINWKPHEHGQDYLTICTQSQFVLSICFDGIDALVIMTPYACRLLFFVDVFKLISDSGASDCWLAVLSVLLIPLPNVGRGSAA